MFYSIYIVTHHWTVGSGSPTHLHSKVIFSPSSDCLITGRSVNVGFIPSSGTGASSPLHQEKLIFFIHDHDDV